MVRPLCLFACLVPLVGWNASSLQAADALDLHDGDRVVLVGNTMIEREQRYGYWELALTRRYPGKKIIFRNLGWSGDTVFGEARAGFGSVADGFRELKDHVLALKPTVIIVGYGANEAFEGKAGLPRFVQGLSTLLDTFAPTKARIILLSPMPQEDLGRPLPDPKEHNKNLRLYTDAIRDVAKKRQCTFVDLYKLLDDKRKSLERDLSNTKFFLDALKAAGVPEDDPAMQKASLFVSRYDRKLTDNGIHLTSWGYWRTASVLEEGLGLPNVTGEIEIDSKGQVKKDQTEKLRQAIIAKNRLYFHRWRPQNVTYLFGFRKHEQGKNAREIPMFDPLVAEKEAEIFKLNKPVTHTYELRPVKK